MARRLSAATWCHSVSMAPGSMTTTSDAERGEFQAQGVAEAFDGELRGVIPAAQRRVDLAADGRDVDDAAAALAAHVRQHELGKPGQPEEIHVELAAGLGHRDVFDARPETP